MHFQRVLIVHNHYLHRGGEDAVVEAEVELLRARGHAVELYSRSNQDIEFRGKLEILAETLWSRRTTRELRDLLGKFDPRIVHVHNTTPLISPSVFWACSRANVPVVQTLHNFRLACLNALFLRQDHVCEDCLGKPPWRGVMHGCYRNSRAASGALAATLMLHRGLGTFRSRIDRYIALNEFCRRKFIEAGIPAQQIAVKPNFVDISAPQERTRTGLLFVGRLSREKGIGVLADSLAASPEVEMRIAGEGPLAARLLGISGVTRLGSLALERVIHEMSRAIALVVPSVWYENFPRTIVEAFACGLPVIASRLGALAEIVEDGITGLLFEPGDAGQLAEKMRWAVANPARMAEMGRIARARYEERYSPAVNYAALMTIYAQARDARTGGAG